MIWTILWILWFVAFLAIELPAAWESYHGHPGGTLSEHVWAWLAIGQPRTGLVHLRRFVFVAGFAVLAVHFFTGGWV